MKWIEVGKARNLEMDIPVYTRNDKGEFHYGKLIKQEKTIKGVEHTFLILRFEKTGAEVFEVKNITHVCILKPKTEDDK